MKNALLISNPLLIVKGFLGPCFREPIILNLIDPKPVRLVLKVFKFDAVIE